MESNTRIKLTEAFLAALREDEIPWQKCWTSEKPTSLGTGKPYHGVNNLILSLAADENGYEDPRWVTFRQAKALGAHVRQGEKSTPIEFWSHYDAVLKKTLEQHEVSAIQKTDPERMKHIVLMCRSYSVFNAEQVVGLPDWQPMASNVHLDVLAAQREQLLSNLGVGFHQSNEVANYSPKLDQIQMPPASKFHSDYAYVCTLLHEAGHATGHESRLNRTMTASFGTPEYAKEELRAEIASAFTAQALGLPVREQELTEYIDQHKAYIQNWIEVLERSPNELFAAIKDAERISDYLMEHGRVRELATEQQERTPAAEQAELEP